MTGDVLVTRLQALDLFQGLSDASLEAICNAASRRRVASGGYFFFQGDPAEWIFVLVEGRIKVSQATFDGQQVLLRMLTPYALFGGVAFSQNETYPANALADEDSLALCWSKARLMDFIVTEPKLALNAVRMMADHVLEFQERFSQLATERVERRLARSILRLASQAGRKIEDGVLIDLPLSRQDLAEMNGTTLYTVSRIMSQWEEQGLVRLGRERVVIRFPHGLVRIAEDLA
jgi:CRP-like cAMP-binding protein